MNNNDDVTKDLKIIAEEKFILGDDIFFDSILNEMSQNGKSIKLAYTESKALQLLIHHNGEIVPREHITDFAWHGRIVTDSSLAKSISNLRKALREFGLEDDSIITVPRMGYRLTCMAKIVEESPSTPSTPSTPSNNTLLFDSPLQSEEDAEIYTSPILVQAPPHRYRWATKQLKNLSVPLKTLMVLTSIGMLVYAGYNVSWRVDQDLNKKFIAKGYELNTHTIQNRSYQVIKPELLKLTSGLESLISLAPDGSLVFIQKRADVYNISYQVNEKGFSFTFKDENISIATCKIIEALYEGERKCGT